jgi:Ca-activated chloride channel family protein
VRFVRPELAGWWEVLPVLVACWAAHAYYVRWARRRTPVAARFARLSRRTTIVRELGILLLSLVAAGALVFALVRPQALLAQRTPQYQKQDLIILLDRSASMRAHDIDPSRFSRAVIEIRNFLRRKPEAIDRVGLVGFADASLILSYLTADTDSIEFYLDWIDRDTQTLLGTDIGAALKSALQVARKDDRPTPKTFLLVSDGEDYGSELVRQLAIYRAAGFRVHCIGIGSDRAVPVPIVGPDGRETALRGDDGRVVMTQFAEGTLRQIAAVTGGRYIRSVTGGELAAGLDEIVRGERKQVGCETTTAYRDLYPYGLGLAGAAGLALWLLL